MTPTPESLTEAVRLLNERGDGWSAMNHATQVLATALDEHKAKMREVSDAMRVIKFDYDVRSTSKDVAIVSNVKGSVSFDDFIIPEPPADPLIDALCEWHQTARFSDEDADKFRNLLAKRNARVVIDAPDKPDAAAVFTDALIAGGVSPDEVCAGHKWRAAIAVIAEALESRP